MEGSLMFRGCQLPPGFRFQPTDPEIIVYYLKRKLAATAASVTSIIADVDIYKFDPWELPEKAVFGEGEWFFFSPRDRKYPNGARPNRTAGSGYWKATGTDKPILAAGGAHCLGVKKALVFYQGRSPKGAKTEWVMHEYRLLDADHHRPRPASNGSMRLDDWVLCRVRNKAGAVSLGPDMDDTSSSELPIHAAAVPAAGTLDYHHHAAENNREVDWTNDGQLLQYLIADEQQPAAGGAAASQLSHHHGGGDRTLVSVLESIKRNLSFQAIDELYLLHGHPNKRTNYMIRVADDDDEHHHQLSSPTSFSIAETDEVF